MKILLYDMGTYTQNDIMDALKDMQIEYRNILYRLSNTEEDLYFRKRVEELLCSEQFDAVFSVNYFPILAKISYTHKIPYLSWSYDSPVYFNAMGETLGYCTNYCFVFDSEECRKIRKKGFGNVYHLPLAVNVDRLDAIEIKKKDVEKYKADISMVGQLYESILPTFLPPLSEYDKGYLSAVMETQMRLYGCYYLEEVITREVTDRINDSYRALGHDGQMFSREGLILAIAKQITHMERTLLLDSLSEKHRVDLYGPNQAKEMPGVRWHGSAGYFDEMPKIFKLSKVNLNVSVKCIGAGIPLRVLDILGSGGFLLTNYQQEIAENFVDGEELAMYTSLEEAVEKCSYYLEHEEERKEIAKQGHNKVKKLFGYEDKIGFMLRTAGLR